MNDVKRAVACGALGDAVVISTQQRAASVFLWVAVADPEHP